MPELLSVKINGAASQVVRGTTVAVAVLLADSPSRISVTGEPRGPLCGMGVCFECCAVVNGIPHRRTCQILCQRDMTIETSR
jgi:sarcosine oxidase subunit alpha